MGRPRAVDRCRHAPPRAPPVLLERELVGARAKELRLRCDWRCEGGGNLEVWMEVWMDVRMELWMRV